MLGYWTDLDRTFAAMDELRRRMEQALAPTNEPPLRGPRVTLYDEGAQLVLKADLPGVAESDVQLQLTNDVLTVGGQRKVETPEGYSIHRQERAPLRFARSFTLPCKVRADEIAATLKNGVLTVTMPKAPESQPRQIAVKSA